MKRFDQANLLNWVGGDSRVGTMSFDYLNFRFVRHFPGPSSRLLKTQSSAMSSASSASSSAVNFPSTSSVDCIDGFSVVVSFGLASLDLVGSSISLWSRKFPSLSHRNPYKKFPKKEDYTL
jgi:hypothetical protein